MVSWTNHQETELPMTNFQSIVFGIELAARADLRGAANIGTARGGRERVGEEGAEIGTCVAHPEVRLELSPGW
jgi:hypothetical protein